MNSKFAVPDVFRAASKSRAMCVGAVGILFAAPTCLFSQQADANPTLARNTVSFELLGHGGAYSLNYGRLINPQFAVRVGLSHYEVQGATVVLDGVEEYRAGSRASLTLVPITASWLRGGTHNLETGGGLLLGWGDVDLEEIGSGGVLVWGVAGLLGYRYQPLDGGLFLRAAYTPLWSGGELSPLWFGFSVGYSF